jgi:hypothetical protein
MNEVSATLRILARDTWRLKPADRAALFQAADEIEASARIYEKLFEQQQVADALRARISELTKRLPPEPVVLPLDSVTYSMWSPMISKGWTA